MVQNFILKCVCCECVCVCVCGGGGGGGGGSDRVIAAQWYKYFSYIQSDTFHLMILAILLACFIVMQRQVTKRLLCIYESYISNIPNKNTVKYTVHHDCSSSQIKTKNVATTYRHHIIYKHSQIQNRARHNRRVGNEIIHFRIPFPHISICIHLEYGISINKFYEVITCKQKYWLCYRDTIRA